MNRRHVRTVAVFAIVLVTLTGARRSGGGCSSDSSSSSSSSSSGGYTSGGSDYSSPSTYSPDALSDVLINTCDYDEATRQLKAGLTITNTSLSDTFNYSVTVKFQKDTGELLGSDFLTTTVSGGQNATETATATYTFTEQTRFECQVGTATKFRSS